MIGFSETWFSESTVDLYGCDGYTQVNVYRRSKRGGGVRLHIHKSVVYIDRKNMALNTACMEAIFVEAEKCNPRRHIDLPIQICAVVFNDVILRTLNTIHQEHKLCYLMGDYNLNLLNATHEPTSDFLNQMYTFSLIPTITKPNRITQMSATLIDNIFTNDLKADLESGILYSDISDCQP